MNPAMIVKFWLYAEEYNPATDEHTDLVDAGLQEPRKLGELSFDNLDELHEYLDWMEHNAQL
jgi:hypothetical protein